MSIQVKRIAFIYHRVTDVARARRFYEQLLGLKVGLEYEGAPGKWWIEYEIAGVAFAITNHEPPQGQGGNRIALEVADIDAALAAVRAAGIALAEELKEFPRCRDFAVTDPDGNEIIFHQLKPAEQVPEFDSAAQIVAPYLHVPTGRTVGHHQAVGDGRMHLFSPTGFFVATEETRTSCQ